MPPPIGLGPMIQYIGGELPPPTIASISPTVGTIAGGTPVRITGTNLVTASVKGSTLSGIVVSAGGTILDGTAVARTAGDGDVVVSNGSVSATLANGFRFISNWRGRWRAKAGITKDGSNKISAVTDETGVSGTFAAAVGAGPLYVANDAGAPAILHDGISQILTTPAFAIAGPYAFYLVGELVSDYAGSNRSIVEGGEGAGHEVIYQNAATGFVAMYAGVGLISDGEWGVGAYKLVRWCFDGVSSYLQVGSTGTLVTADTGGLTLTAGLTIGGRVGPVQCSNLKWREFNYFNSHPSVADDAAIMASMKAEHGTP